MRASYAYFKENINKFLHLFGWKGFIATALYPILTLVTTTVRLGQTLWNSRQLLDGKHWEDYPHFDRKSSINSLFYWNLALSFYRHGRSGTSPFSGLGNFKLSQRIQYSLPSLYAYWKAGAVTLLLGMFSWWIIHFIWLGSFNANKFWILLILYITVTSTTFYSQTFMSQNYNVLGWLFLPAVLYGWHTQNWALASIAALGASLGSITAVTLVFLLSPLQALQISSLAPVISVFPAGLKLFTHFWPNIKGGNIYDACLTILKAIGASKGNSKYIRKNMTKFSFSRLYLLVIYSQFVIVYYVKAQSVPVLVVASIGIWIVNSILCRFADDQSMELLILTTTTASMLSMIHPDIGLIISFWFLVSPIPLFQNFRKSKTLAIVPKFAPFNIRPILEEFEKFLAPVKKGQRILMAFEDPQGQYEKIFDGYRYLLEVPLYISAKNEIHFMPDWWGVFELNYSAASDFWGRKVKEVQRQIMNWRADYVIVYQKQNTRLKKKWTEAGFISLSHLSCSLLEMYWGANSIYKGTGPEMWLLRKEEQSD